MHCHGHLSPFVPISGDVFLRDFLRCRVAANLTLCEERLVRCLGSPDSRRNHRLGERGTSPSQPRDHPQILGIPYVLEVMVGRAVEYSKHQCLSPRISGTHAAEHWCGSTDGGVTTGIEVGCIVRLSLRDGWSKCRCGKNECGQ